MIKKNDWFYVTQIKEIKINAQNAILETVSTIKYIFEEKIIPMINNLKGCLNQQFSQINTFESSYRFVTL